MKPKFLGQKVWIAILVIFSLAVVALRLLWPALADWREDQATTIWLGHYLPVGQWSVGVMDSTNLPNPNGMLSRRVRGRSSAQSIFKRSVDADGASGLPGFPCLQFAVGKSRALGPFLVLVTASQFALGAVSSQPHCQWTIILCSPCF